MATPAMPGSEIWPIEIFAEVTPVPDDDTFTVVLVFTAPPARAEQERVSVSGTFEDRPAALRAAARQVAAKFV